MEDTRKQGKTVISGKDAFTLYDTYGFPLDLTELILRENQLTVDEEEFKVEMDKQKTRARNAAAVETGDWIVVREGECEFVGYDVLQCETRILRYRKVKQKNNEFYQIVLETTPFYAEMGGQVGDMGWLGDVEIFDTKRENNLAVHLSKKMPQNMEGTLVAKVNEQKRVATACNHSATHLLHEALREVLGTHVEQKGSYVTPDTLRFDFSHFQKLTPEEIRQVEMLTNQKIRANYPLDERRNVPIAEAKALGAMALFGEKYGDSVRVIRFGTSAELCGGTHVKATGQIGMLRIISESSIAAGVRRVEAVTAEGAEKMVYAQQEMLETIRQFFNNAPDLVQTIKKSIDENANLKKQIDDFVQEKVMRIREVLLEKSTEINGVKVIQLQGDFAPDMVRSLVSYFRGKFVDQRFLFVAGTVHEGKPSLTIFLSQQLVDAGLNAVNMVREAAKNIQGGGGGQPFMAQAGGKNPDGIHAAVKAVVAMIEAL